MDQSSGLGQFQVTDGGVRRRVRGAFGAVVVWAGDFGRWGVGSACGGGGAGRGAGGGGGEPFVGGSDGLCAVERTSVSDAMGLHMDLEYLYIL